MKLTMRELVELHRGSGQTFGGIRVAGPLEKLLMSEVGFETALKLAKLSEAVNAHMAKFDTAAEVLRNKHTIKVGEDKQLDKDAYSKELLEGAEKEMVTIPTIKLKREEIRNIRLSANDVVKLKAFIEV